MKNVFLLKMATGDGEFNDKVGAIKALRAISGMGLKESKDLLEGVQSAGEKTVSFEVKRMEEAEFRNYVETMQAAGVRVIDVTAGDRVLIVGDLKEIARRCIALEDYELSKKIIDILEEIS